MQYYLKYFKIEHPWINFYNIEITVNNNFNNSSSSNLHNVSLYEA